MGAEEEFTIGEPVACTDGDCGQLRNIVIDPVAKSITHLVVEEKHRVGLGRLVPTTLVGATSGGTVTLTCSLAEYQALEVAEEVRYLPGTAPGSLSLPFYGLNTTIATPVVLDKAPLGEVTFHRGDAVHAIDGVVGKVEGLVVDERDHQVTHVLLQEGHLFDHDDVSIPISNVTSFTDGVLLNLTKDEVRALPSIAVERHR